MSFLGLRASAQEVRYAILEKNVDGSIAFVNQSGENRLKYPANVENIEEKLRWIKIELDRILRQNSSIEKVIIKTNEYTGKENAAIRETIYADAIFLLCAAEHGLPVVRKLNSQIGSTATQAKELAERRVGKTEKYWNKTIAEAVLAAFWEMK